MAFCNPMLVGASFPNLNRERDLPMIKRPVIQLIRSREQNVRGVEACVSRRDTLLYLTTETLCGFTVCSTEPAEARVGRFEMKKKIMEKLEKLREKAGISKPKAQNVMPEDGKLAPLAPPIPFPNPQEGAVGPLVESTVP